MSSKYVAEWEQVIPLLSSDEIRKLEEILKQAQTKQQNGKQDSTSSQHNGESHVVSNGHAAPTSPSSDVQILSVSGSPCINGSSSLSQTAGHTGVSSQAHNKSTGPLTISTRRSLLEDSRNNPPSSCTTARDDVLSRSSSPFSSESSGIGPKAHTATSGSSLGRTYENGRRNLKDEDVNESEARRRAKRRERNRVAAATCRQRRQDHITSLQVKVSHMKAVTDRLADHVASLRTEKAFLTTLLAEHQCVYSATSTSRSNGKHTRVHLKTLTNSSVKEEHRMEVCIVPSPPQSPPPTAGEAFLIDDTSPMRPNSLPIPTAALDSIMQEMEQMTAMSPTNGETNSRMPRLTPLMTPGAWSVLKKSLTSDSNNATSSTFTDASGIPPVAAGVAQWRHSSSSTSEYSVLAPEVGYLSLLSPSRVLYHANDGKPPFFATLTTSSAAPVTINKAGK